MDVLQLLTNPKNSPNTDEKTTSKTKDFSWQYAWFDQKVSCWLSSIPPISQEYS
jgi:hypothetical protein